MAVPKKNMGKALKITDKRYKTKGGQIRIEVWADAKTRHVTAYNFAYINNKFDLDNGRLLGFDDSHFYPGFTTRHHCH